MLDWLKKNWYFPLLLAGVVTAVVAGRMGTTGSAPGEPADTAKDSKPLDPKQQSLRDEFERAKAVERARKSAEEPERTTEVIIAEHLEKLEANPEPTEAAGRLAALGNLYLQKKRDYKTAAGYYERLIQEYPDWPGANAIYHQLITCYTQLDDQGSLRLLYRKMVEVFPPESKEYEFARYALDNP